MTKYTVRIRQNNTGEIRTAAYDFDFNLSWWTDGNYGCDCNRQWEFERAGNDGEYITEDPDCGYNRYAALDATLADGSLIVIGN